MSEIEIEKHAYGSRSNIKSISNTRSLVEKIVVVDQIYLKYVLKSDNPNSK